MHKNILLFFFTLYCGIASCAWSVKAWTLQMGGYPTAGTYWVYAILAFSVYIVLLEFFDKSRHRFLVWTVVVFEFVAWLLMHEGHGTNAELDDLAFISMLAAGIITVVYRFITRHEK